MASLTFDAPTLFAPGAAPRGPAVGAARQKRLLRWLRDRLATHGVDAFGPMADERGWRLAVHAEDGFVTIRLDRNGGGGRTLTALVDKLGEADAEYEDTLAALESA